MKHALLLVLCTACGPRDTAAPDAAEARSLDRLDTTPALQHGRLQLEVDPAYRIDQASGELQLANALHGFTGRFTASGLELRTETWRATSTVAGLGCGDLLAPLPAGGVRARDNRVEQRQGLVTTWYLNGPRGLQQNFTVAEPPGCFGGLPERRWGAASPRTTVTIALELAGLAGEVRDAGTWVALRDPTGRTVLRYGDLVAEDARGTRLPARLRARGSQLLIDVDAAGAEFPLEIDPTFAFTQKLLPDSAGDLFGHAVALDGDTLVAGALLDSQVASTAGAVFVYVRSGGTWTLQQKLVASDGAARDRFGKSVDISGDTIVVGVPSAGNADTPTGRPGAVYVFTRSGTTWSQVQKLTASDGAANDRFGQTVRLQGDRLIVSRYKGGNGAAYIYERVAGTFGSEAKLVASDSAASDEFGYFVDLDGDFAAIGARRDDIGANADQGSVYVFNRAALGSWTEAQKLVASDGATGDFFGRSLALSGSTLLVGAIRKDGGTGAAYVFQRTGSTWSQQQKLVASDRAGGDEFARMLMLSGDVAVIGALRDDVAATNQGSVYVFSRAVGGTSWTQDQRINAPDAQASNEFGKDVALGRDGTLVIGAHLDNDLGANTGSVYVFDLPSKTLTNGSFENDYTGWTLLEDSSSTDFGVFGIATDGQAFAGGEPVFDFADGVTLTYAAPAHTYDATAGSKVAFHIQPNGPPTFGAHRMFQTVTIPAGCDARLRWDMEYESSAPLDPVTQFTAVNVRSAIDDSILATPFKTAGAAPLVVAPMTPFEANLAAFAGQTIRLDFQHEVNDGPFQVAWDNIRIDCIVAAPAISVAPSNHDFLEQRVATTSADQTFTITNTGDANLIVTSITTAAPFAVTPGTLPATIAPGDTHVFTGRFTPSATGLANGTISIASNVAGSPTAVTVKGTGTAPAIAIAPTAHDFGNQRVTTTSAAKQFAISNPGTAPLSITGATTTGPFTVAATTATIPPGGTLNVDVTFTPTVIGAVGGTLQIAHDAGGSPKSADLSGTGIAPLIALPAEIDIPPQRVGTTSAAQLITVTNTGSDTLTIDALATAGDFAVLTTAPLTIPPGGNKQVQVTITPSVTGPITGALEVSSDALNKPSASVVLNGSGIEPAISAPPSVAFGDVRVGQTLDKVVTVTNVGSAPLVISGITATGAYSTTSTFPITIPVGDTADITVRFAPTAAGPSPDTIELLSDAPTSPTSVSVDGTGVEPLIATDVPSVDFGLQRVGVPSLARTLVVSNPGTFPLTVSAATTSAPFELTSAAAFVIAPGSQELVTVRFTPAAEGGASQLLTLEHDAAGSPTTISLQGLGTVANVSASPATLAFGTIRVGTTSAPQPLTIRNLGLAPLEITAITPPAGFTATGLTLPHTVLPNGAVTVDIAFAPAGSGDANGSLEIATSGGAASIAVEAAASTTALAADLAVVELGAVVLGEASEVRTVVLTNTTAVPVTIANATPDPGFVLDPPPTAAPIPPGGSVTFGVRFVPVIAGEATGKIRIALTASPQLDLELEATGIGVAEGGGCCSAGGEPSSLLLGLVVLGLLRRRQRR